MFEAGILKDIPKFRELVFGFSEAIPIIILGLLVSYALRNEKVTNDENRQDKSLASINSYISIFLISVLYLVFRYAGYSLVHIQSQFISKPAETFFWTLGNGVLIGVFYAFLRPMMRPEAGAGKYVMFGIIIFGIDWFFYNMFVPVFFSVSYFEIFRSFVLRAFMDIAGICAGVYFSEKVVKRYLQDICS